MELITSDFLSENYARAFLASVQVAFYAIAFYPRKRRGRGSSRALYLHISAYQCMQKKNSAIKIPCVQTIEI